MIVPSAVLRQINFQFRNNDGGLQPVSSGGASDAGAINEFINWEASGEGYTGGIARCLVTIQRNFGPSGGHTFRITYSRNGAAYITILVLSGDFIRIVVDPDNIFFEHNDDCPFSIGTIGGPGDELRFLEENFGAISDGNRTGAMFFPGEESGEGNLEQCATEFSFRIRAEESGNADIFEFKYIGHTTGEFNNYVNIPKLTVLKQLIGDDWISAGFRGRLDDGPEELPATGGGASWIADINVGWTELIGGEGFAAQPVRTIRPRHLIQAALPFDDEVQFVQRYAHKPKGGIYGPDLEVTASSAVIQTASSTFLTDGADSTELSDRIGSGSWLANAAGVIETGIGSFHNWTTAAEEVELEFCNRIVPADLQRGDKIRLRVYRVVPPTAAQFNSEASYPLETYSEELEITIDSVPAEMLDAGIATLLDTKGQGTFPDVGQTLPTTGTVIMIGEEQEMTAGQGMIAVIPEAGTSERELGEFPRYQVISSDLSYDVALARAEAVHQALHGHQGALLGRPVGRITADFEPIPLGRGVDGVQGGRFRFTQTFTVITRKFSPLN